MYLLLGLAVLNIIAFVLMYVTGHTVGPLPKAIQTRAMENYDESKRYSEKMSADLSEL